MPKCNTCPEVLSWKKPYVKGDRPLGSDGKPHNCPNWQPKERTTKRSYMIGCDASEPSITYYLKSKKNPNIKLVTGNKDELNNDEWELESTKEIGTTN